MGQLLTTDQRDFEGSGALAWLGSPNVTLSKDSVAPIAGLKSLKALTTSSGPAYWLHDPIYFYAGVRTFNASALFKGPINRAMQLVIRRYEDVGLTTWTDQIHPFTSTGAAQTVTGSMESAVGAPAFALYFIDYASINGDAYWVDSLSFTDESEPATFLIELGLTADPLDALSAVTWTDITSDFKSVSFSKGRSKEGDPIQAGTCSVRVDNSSGDYDPNNTTGAHYPNLKPNKRLRVSLISEGVTYRRFTGYLDSIKTIRHNVFYNEVELRATDAFKLLNLANLRDPYEVAVLDATPKAFYRFKDVAVSSERAYAPAADSVGQAQLTFYNPKQEVDGFTVGFEPISSHLYAPGALVNFWDTAKSIVSTETASQYAGYGIAATAGVTGTAAFSYSFIFQRPAYHRSASHGSVLVQAEGFASTETGGNIWLFDGPYDFDPSVLALKLRIYVSGTEILELQSQMGHYNGANWEPHRLGVEALYQVVITRSGADFSIYGRNLSAPGTGTWFVTATAPSNPSFASSRIWLATAQAHQHVAGVFYTYPGLLAEFATYDSALTSNERAAIFDATTQWEYDLPGERVGHVLDQIGWPAADRSLENGSTELAKFTATGSSVLAHLQEAAITEDGVFFIDGEGRACLFGRHHLITAARSTAVQIVFGEEVGEIPYEPSVDPTMDENEIYNMTLMQREGGLPQTSENSSSMTAHGPRQLTETGLIAASDNDMAARAVFKAEQYSEPKERVRTMTFSELDSLEHWTEYPPACGVELWDRVTFRQRLEGAVLWEQDSIVEGFSQTYDTTSQQHKITLHLSSLPASLSDGGFWVLGVSALNLNAKVAY